MKITRTSPWTGEENTIDIPITEDEYARIMSRRETGEYIQNIIPHIGKDLREFIISGYTPTDWLEMFGNEEDDERSVPDEDEMDAF